MALAVTPGVLCMLRSACCRVPNRLPSCFSICLPACSKEALFPGKSEIDELQLILKTMGSPTEQSWPGGAALTGELHR